MKSYFAKLAARATLANVPVSRAVTSTDSRDPFEDRAAQPIVPPLSGVAQPGHPPQPAMTHATPDSRIEARDRRRSETDSVDIEAPTTSQRLNAPAPRVVHPNAPVERPAETAIPLDPPRTDHPPRADSQALRRTLVPDTTRLAPPEPSPSAIPTFSAKEKDASRSTAIDETERLAEIRKEQSMLLRKADAFMAGMFDRSQRATTREDADSEDERQTVPERSESPRQTATRLQPMVSPTRVSEPVDQEPSLVIGKLSVEVLPPAAPPVAPQRQVVVINAGQRTRAGVPSSQRFGFSRF